jgi:hypothetical protein
MWHDVQLPKALLVWIEQHPGLASWLQAVGVISALFITLYVADLDRRERAQERRLKARALATLLHSQLVAFQGELERAVKSQTYLGAAIRPPASLVERTDQLYLLGDAGNSLLQMIASLNANLVIISTLEREQVPSDPQFWKGIHTLLFAAQICCTGAVAEIDRITALPRAGIAKKEAPNG